MLKKSIFLLIAFLHSVFCGYETLDVPIDDTISSDTYRLPNNTIPLTYDISIETRVDKNDFKFTGLVKINVFVIETSSHITLHHRQLTIESANLWITSSSAPLPLTNWTYSSPNNDFEFLTFNFNEFLLLANSNYTLEIHYSGYLRNDTRGFYRSYYVNENDEIIYIATTHFEPHNARHGFPCYDEPALKAHFTLNIKHGVKFHALSNMPESRKINLDNDTVITSFDQTPLMSTYLLAFVISDFTNISNYENKSIENIRHRSFARPTAKNLTDLSLTVGINVLNVVENYVGINYSLPKMDQIAVPSFAAGAMENWGLVIYREPFFLFNENENTYITKTNIIITIAHEFAHQWFGNLVSPQWWTYIWLNEGFATLFEYIATDIIFPNWKFTDFFIINVLQPIFIQDATEIIRPMTHYVESPMNILNLFDDIAYEKSGCVLRMIQSAFGATTFQRGIKYYLNERQYSDAAEGDLFDGIERAVIEDGFLSNNFSVHQIMLSWTRQGGYPFIHVERNYKENTIRISQERYLTYTTGTIPSNTWWIPLNFATASDPDFSDTKADEWLPGNVRVKDIFPSEDRTWNSSDWIVFNKQQTGYYRVRYDRDNYKLIADELYYGDHEQIHRLSRSQLIDDAFIFARTNRLDWDIPFDIIKYLQNEIEYVPWQSTIVHLNYINRFMPGLRNYYLYWNFLGNLFEKLFDSVGIEDVQDEQLSHKYARTIAIDWACKYDYENCMEKTNQRLRQSFRNNKVIHQNVKSVIYCAGLRNGDLTDFEAMLNLTLNTDLFSLDRALWINAMGCFSNNDILLKYLNLSIDINNIYLISQTERYSAFNSVYQNTADGLALSIRFLINNIDEAHLSYSNNLNNILTDMAAFVINENILVEFSKLLEIVREGGHASVVIIERAYEVLYQNIRWINSNARPIEIFFDTIMNNL